jgi:P53 DNA-binding domain
LNLKYNLIYSRRVYGRQVLPLRVCASPHRDRKQEEDKISKNHGIDKAQLAVKAETPAQYGGSSTDAANSREYLGSLDQMFFIPVRFQPSCYSLIQANLSSLTGQQL